MTGHDESSRPAGSLSLDLDNLWAYMKTHGDAGWECFPSYLDLVVPRILRFLEERDLTITFFIVGQDAALEKNRNALASIAAAGHEIANHSFHHEPRLSMSNVDQIEAELRQAEEAIRSATGRHPKGFRGPSFALSGPLLQALERRGYEYDASTFPTFLGPLARAYYFLKSDLTTEQRTKRKHLFGRWRDGLRPLDVYRWKLDGGSLLEVPVTTLPYLRAPFHFSYIIYLATFSPAMARSYFRLAIRLCRRAGIQPSALLHPLDFMGNDDTGALAFFPGMTVPAATKIGWLSECLADYARHFEIVPIGELARRRQDDSKLAVRRPDFDHLESVGRQDPGRRAAGEWSV